MSGSYVVIASVLLYLLIVRLSSGRDMHPLFSATIVVVLPFLLTKLLWYLYLVGFNLPLEQLFSWSDILLLPAQFIVATVVFYKLRANDSLESWLLWGIVGLVGIYFAVPYFVQLVMPG